MATDSANTRVLKRSLVIAGHRTSVSLEDAFWRRLRALAAERGLSLNGLAAMIDASRDGANLSSAIRVFVLEAEGSRGELADGSDESGSGLGRRGRM
jgi:predicted DNA-binding ribbon-helix-helix protein